MGWKWQGGVNQVKMKKNIPDNEGSKSKGSETEQAGWVWGQKKGRAAEESLSLLEENETRWGQRSGQGANYLRIPLPRIVQMPAGTKLSRLQVSPSSRPVFLGHSAYVYQGQRKGVETKSLYQSAFNHSGLQFCQPCINQGLDLGIIKDSSNSNIL